MMKVIINFSVIPEEGNISLQLVSQPFQHDIPVMEHNHLLENLKSCQNVSHYGQLEPSHHYQLEPKILFHHS